MSTITSTTSATATGSTTDHHCGWENILSSETVTIAARKQMVVYGEFILDGILNIDGSLILED